MQPQYYDSERAFMTDMYEVAASCSRHYYLSLWLPAFERGGGRLGAPAYTGPPVPRWNRTHDTLVQPGLIASRRAESPEGDARRYKADMTA
jgi:hypothetical protein